jgi:hypothetical protein
VILLARHFGVSRTTAIYRLKNLRLISQAELEGLLLQEREGQGGELERSLALPTWKARRQAGGEAPEEGPLGDHDGDFRTRFLSLALEAYRLEKISRGKLHELGRMVDTRDAEIDDLLELLGFLDDDSEDEVLLPDE